MAAELDAAPAPDAEDAVLLKVAQTARYRELVRERSRFSWSLTIVMLVIFFGYILLIAFAPQILALRISRITTLGIPIGIGVIVSGIVLTGIYVHRANSRFDPMIREIVEESRGE